VDFGLLILVRGVGRIADEIERRTPAHPGPQSPRATGTSGASCLRSRGARARLLQPVLHRDGHHHARLPAFPSRPARGGRPGALRSTLQGPLYASIHAAPIPPLTGIENAELIKGFLYKNTLTSRPKIARHTAMELCHGKNPGADVDDVIRGGSAWEASASSRAGHAGGHGDRRRCHPRDNLALRHCRRELGASYDWFAAVMASARRQTDGSTSSRERRGSRTSGISRARRSRGSNLTLGSPRSSCATCW